MLGCRTTLALDRIYLRMNSSTGELRSWVMEIDKIQQGKRDEILRIAASHGARDVPVLGSLARGEAGAASDIDILVKLEPGRSLLDIVAIKQDLEDLIGCEVDVVTEATISPYIREEVPRGAVSL
jgi:predicted nucleotidyltransferase